MEQMLQVLRQTRQDLMDAFPKMAACYVVTVDGLTLDLGKEGECAPNVSPVLQATRFPTYTAAKQIARLVRNGKGTQGKAEDIHTVMTRAIAELDQLLHNFAPELPTPKSVATVKRTGKTWGVFVNDRLVEGGFFSRAAAQEAAKRA